MVRESVEFLLDSTGAEAGARKFEQSIDKVEKATVDADKELRELERRLLGVDQGLDRLGNELRANSTLTAQSAAATERLNRHYFEQRRAAAEAARAQELLGRTSRTATNDLNRLSRAAAQPARAFGSLVAPVTRLAAVLGVGFGVRQAATSLASFETTLVTVGQVAGATAEQYNDLRDTALRFGETTEFTSTQAGEGLLFLARAGFAVDEAISALPATLNLATAAQLQLGEAADIASNVLSQYALNVEQLNDVNDALVATSNNANTDVRQLAEALKFAGPLAGTLGVELNQTVAALGAFGDRGVQASSAGTTLTATFRSLLKPSEAFKEAVENAGLSLSDFNPALNDLATIGRRVGTVLDNLPEGVSVFDLARTEGARGLALLSASADSVESLVGDIDRLKGVTDETAAAIRDTLGGSFNTLASALEGVLQRTGEDGLTGSLRGITDFATETVRKLGGIESAADDYGVASAAAAAATEAFVAALAIQGGVGFLRFVTGAVSGLGELTTRLLSAARAQQSLSAAFAINPAGAIAVGVLAAVTAYRALQVQIEATRRQQRAFIDQVEGDREPLRRVFDAFNFDDPSATGPEQQLGRLQAQLRGIQTALSAVQRAGDPAFEFDGTEAAVARFEELQREIAGAESRVERLQVGLERLRRDAEGGRNQAAASFLSVTLEQLEGAQLELQTLQAQLTDFLGTAGAVEIDGARFVSADFVRQAARATDQVREFEAALAESAEVTGLGQTLIREGAALRILEEAAQRTRVALSELNDSQADSQAAADGFKVALEELTQPLRLQERTLAARRELLDGVADSERTLADARRELAIQDETRNRSQAIEQALLQRNIRVTGEQRTEIESLVRGYVELEASLKSYEDDLSRGEQAQDQARQSALDTVDALQAQIDALNGIDPAVGTVEQAIRALNIAFGSGSDEAEQLIERIRRLQGELGDTQAAAARREQEDAVSDVLRQVEQDIERLGLTGDGARRFDAARVLEQRTGQDARPEDVDRLAADFAALEAAERAAARVDIASGGLADASGDLVRSLVDGTASLSDAARNFGQQVTEAILEGFVVEPVRQFAAQLAQSIFGAIFGAGGFFGPSIPGGGGGASAFSSGGSGPGFSTGGFSDGFKSLGSGGGGSASASSGGGGGGGGDSRTVIINQRISVQGSGSAPGDPAGFRRAAGVSGRALARSVGRRV